MEKKHRTVKELPVSERPYEKCLSMGPESLSDAELLAVILRTGTKEQSSIELAETVLLQCMQQGSLNGLHYITIEDLMKIPGIGTVKAIQLKCILELAARIAKQERKKMVKFTQPQSVAHYYMQQFRFKEQEEVLLIMLDTKGQLIREKTISSGTINYAVVEPREIFTTAFSYHAVQIILLHNHPSGDPRPSKEDVMVTERIKEAGELVGVKLIDHIIIGDNQYVSMRENNML